MSVVGVLEIQLMAGMARLSDDMRRAERVVGQGMGAVERHVSSASRAMNSLGMGLSIGLIADQLRHMTDSFVKMDAQLQLSTKSQAQYNMALADVRRISTVAQSDINATTMLYTRLLNVTDGMGVSQAQVATVTETVSYGLKAYGATAAEAASASLQLSQAMGANRLGGEEFRAVMEAMPNVMKVLAQSMGVPLGELRAMSIAGKITAAEMIKAFGDPAIAAQFKKMAESTQTITGAWTVARNEMMLLFGEFAKSSGLTQGVIASFNMLAGALRVIADYLPQVIAAFGSWALVAGGRLVMSLVAARMAQMQLNAAHAEALVMNIAVAKSADALAAANFRAAGATTQLAAAEKLKAAGSLGIMGMVKGAVGKAGWIGMAIFGIWTVVDFLTGMQQVADGAKKTAADLAGMNIVQLQLLRNAQALELSQMKHAWRGEDRYSAEIAAGRAQLEMYDKQIAKTAELMNAENAARNQPGATSTEFSHDELVMQQRMLDLAKQFNEQKLTEAEYLKRVNEELSGGKRTMKESTDEMLRQMKVEDDLISRGYDKFAALEKETQAVRDGTQAMRDDTAEMGLTTVALLALQKARVDDAIAVQQRKLSILDAGIETAELAQIRATILALQDRKKAMDEHFEAEKASVKEMSEVWKTFADNTQRTLSDVFYNGLTGKFQDIEAAFKDMLLRMLANAAAARLSESMFGSGKSGSSTGWVGAIAGLLSMDGGGYTGSGSRSGGVDGMGGFPAILHPNETVIDHTRGQGGGGAVVINDYSTYNVDSRADRQQIMTDMSKLIDGKQAQFRDKLQREGALA